MHKILVTGANGFVGSALCNTLNARNISFVGAIRNKTEKFGFDIGNMTGTTNWSEALAGCNTVIHLAARVHIMNDNVSDALSAYREINVDATMNLARQAVDLGIKRFVYVSSVKVNGEATTNHFFTSNDVPAPIDLYGQSKFEAECALQELSRLTGMEVVIVRPPLVYGPGVRANFRRLMQLVKIGVPLPLSSIDNRRSMVALDNLVDFLILCSHHPAAAGHIFMVSDDEDVSTSQLLRMLSRAMGKRSLLFPAPAMLISGIAGLLGKSSEASRLLSSLQVDILHTKRTLDWKPVASMQESINKTVSHFLLNH